MKICQVEGCNGEAIECIFVWSEDGKEPEWYCPNHAFENGYCYGCGIFQSGIERFDFGPYKGLCDNCRDEVKSQEIDEYMDFQYYQDEAI